jgi:hypothetical protein
VQDKSWNAAERDFGAHGGPGCLARLARVLSSDSGDNAVSPALQAPLKAAILDFLLRVVGDDPAIRNRGDATQVLAAALVRTGLTPHNLPADCSNDRADECSTWTNSSKAAISIAK